MFRFVHYLTAALIVGLVPTQLFSVVIAAEPNTAAVVIEKQVEPFLKTYCVECHGPNDAKGQFTVHDLSGELAGEAVIAKWEQVLSMLANHEMPPEDAEQPSAATRRDILAAIDARLIDHAVRHPADTQPATARRLTNLEYHNTLRDLLGFELNLIDNLPADPVKPYHFNNTAEFMLIGPEQMDRYLENARRAMAAAIVDSEKPKIHRTAKQWKYEPKTDALSAAEVGVYGGGGGRLGVGNGMNLQSWPEHGEFVLRIKAGAVLPAGYSHVPLRLIMGYGGGDDAGTRLVKAVGDLRLTNAPDNPQVFEIRGRIENIPFVPGKIINDKVVPPSMTVSPQNLFDNGELNDHRKSAFDTSWDREVPRAVIESIEFEAPVADVWPPRHHTNILFASPLRQSDQPGYVRAVLQRFMSRAYRRPVTDDELNRFVKIHDLLARDLPTFEAAMRETLALVLISPQFLYHTAAGDNKAARQYELAAKLSYFLWASMPDAELLKLAEQGKLDDPQVIEAQVIRLLADRRAADFVDNFTTQWLSLTKQKTVSINKDLFPRFLYLIHVGERKDSEVANRPTIRDYMHAETVGFIGELIKRNASVRNIIDSDFAMLNQPLAAHYGVADVEGNELRPVQITPEHRLGGLLTQGSILIGNSTGSAPHPIYRAVWLREAILGEFVRAPPAEVPALTDTAGDAAATVVTIKDLLKKHRQQESCNVCHAALDPWGIPFEQYNAVGKYQPLVPKSGVRVRGFNMKLDQDLAGYAAYLRSINLVPVQADAVIPHGPKLDGMTDLKKYLIAERQDDIARNVLRRLLAYGLGRELTWRDRQAIEQLHKQARVKKYPLRDMIVLICQSELFRGKIHQEPQP